MFLKDLAEIWSEEGRGAMLHTAKPTVFFATCARLIGPEVKLTIEQTLPGNLSMEDWTIMREIIASVRQAIPDAASAPPGVVLERVCRRSGPRMRRFSTARRMADFETVAWPPKLKSFGIWPVQWPPPTIVNRTVA